MPILSFANKTWGAGGMSMAAFPKRDAKDGVSGNVNKLADPAARCCHERTSGYRCSVYEANGGFVGGT